MDDLRDQPKSEETADLGGILRGRTGHTKFRKKSLIQSFRIAFTSMAQAGSRLQSAGKSAISPTHFRTPMKTILSYGMGVESSLLVYWTENSSHLDFDLTEDLIVVTATTGDEYIDTKLQTERLTLPRIRAHDIRYVQVEPAGHFESDGIVVLDDTREPRTVYLDGAYKLSDELCAAGTLPQYAGAHICSIKF